ncbi:MAG: hypothetical protein NVSMB57_11920 [Actinomycetota bacterium]
MQTINEAAKSLGAHATLPLVLATAERMRLQRLWQNNVIDITKILEPKAREAAAAAAGRARPFTSKISISEALTAGDLNGDGLDDLIGIDGLITITDDGTTFTFRLERLSFEGRSGKDGTLLWTKPISIDATMYNLYLVPLRKDVTGDGKADALLVRLDVQPVAQAPCAILVCVGPDVANYTWQTQVLSGATGKPVWSDSVDGTAAFVGAGAGVPFGFGVTGGLVATNAQLDVAPAGDLNGDKLGDLFVSAYDTQRAGAVGLAYPVVGFAGALAFEGMTATHTRGLAGSTGKAIFAKTRELGGGFAAPFRGGRRSGATTDDVAWTDQRVTPANTEACAFAVVDFVCAAGTEEGVVDLLRGPAFQSPAWTYSEEHVGQVPGIVAGLRGTADDDVILLSDQWATAVNGSTGKPLWSHRTSDGFSYGSSLYSLDASVGGPGVDLIEIQSFYEPDSFGVRYNRLSGATGTVLFSTTHEVPANPPVGSVSGYADGAVIGDVDLDGVPDLLTQLSIYYYDAAGLLTGTATHAIVESAKTGTVLTTLISPDESSYVPVGDLSGTGTPSLVRVRSLGGGATFEIAALKLPSGTQTWSRTDANPTNDLSFTLFDAGRVTPGPAHALYLGRSRSNGPDSIARYDILDGKTGAQMWGAGDPMP